MSDRPWPRPSSSKTATGTSPAIGVRSISRMASAPASRLPMTATRRPTRWVPRCQANSREWKRRAPMAMVTKAQPTRTTTQRDSLEGGSSSRCHELSISSHTSLNPASTRGGDRRQQDLARLLDAGVAPDAAVEAEHPVGAQVDDEGDDDEERRSDANRSPEAWSRK